MKCILIITIILLSLSAFAKKPTVSWDQAIQKSDRIAVGEATNSCSYCNLQNTANFKILNNYKGKKLAKNVVIEVVAPNLSFKKGNQYILFLENSKESYNWVSINSPRPLANIKNLEKLKSLLLTLVKN